MADVLTTRGLHVIAYGSPTTQGSHRPLISKSTGRAILKEEMGQALMQWRSAVTAAALRATRGRLPPFDGPVITSVTFTLGRPRSHFRTGRYSGLLRDDAPPRPGGPPDCEKLVRAVNDALTDARVWKDDALVVACWSAKYYPPVPWVPGGTWNLGVTVSPRDIAGVDGADVMAAPGVVIRIERIST